ncbi:glycoside hydrolase family 97 catalytic domain-containing protein [Halorubrum sp. GN12_10-3_MGM]|uniref:glycoside hydrolase family 97 catalytic domain-containing protein n=1 Tax=Halorubrum sp. GN12_10-3_MGM TaxID=2518113 RepID=UPI001F5420B3|nr:glycoside hydrolase family 97 catalytic domain-containing protein [Halorubrum sp. GN12_10-3_MGM]
MTHGEAVRFRHWAFGKTAMMNRRRLLMLLGGAAGASAVGTGAFSSVTTNQDVSVEVAGDTSGYLALTPSTGPNSEYATVTGANQLGLNFSDTAAGGQGVGTDSVYTFDDVFQITNQGTQTIYIWGTFDFANVPFSTDAIYFYPGNNRDQRLRDGQDEVLGLGVGESESIGVYIDTEAVTTEQTLPVTIRSAVEKPNASNAVDQEDLATQTVSSPDGSINMTVDVSSGVPNYTVTYEGTTYVESSPIGFNFSGQEAFGTDISGSGPNILVTGGERGTTTEEWTPEWGEFASVEEEYSYLTLNLQETTEDGRAASLEVRVFNSGLGFRVVLDDGFGEFSIDSENTEFNFAGDYDAWWIENEWVNPRFEQEYATGTLSDIPSGGGSTRPNGNSVRRGAHTPLTMDTGGNGPYLSVHESNLKNYASLSLASQSNAGSPEFAAELAPLPDGSSVKASAPHMTPWRTIQIGDTPGDLVGSQLIPLLADPLDESVFPSGDTSWLENGRKYVGIWWTMIAGSANWEYKSDSEISGNPAAYIHGARTERMKRYMRFASEHGLDSVLAEGWNEGWSSYGADADGTTLEIGIDDSYPDFDVNEVTEFGANLSTPVEMTIHNETSGNLGNYEDEIKNESIFEDYEDVGIRSIKNGYVNDPGLYDELNDQEATHTHHSQRAVNHHQTVIQAAAANRQMLEIHEGIKPTGEIRTYPNVAAREVVKAQEYDGFGALGTNVGRDHHVTLPFTRMLAGPTSYQPGIFDITFNDTDGDQIQTTRAKQLAMYPVYLAGLQMAADRIEAYIDSTFEIGEFVQAQAGDLNNMFTADQWRNAYGAHYVPVDPSRGDPDRESTATFTIKNVTESGTYDLHLRYASDEEDNRNVVTNNGNPELTLLVNGSERKLTPAFTDYWDDWDIHTVSIDLEAGDNTVAIELGPNEVGGLNLNTIGVTEQNSDPPFPAAYTDFENTHTEKENYDTEPEFDFIKQVPTSWDETIVVDAAIGEYIIVARRNGEEWFLGAMTDGNARGLTVPLDEFLTARDNGWSVTEYADASGTGVDSDPTKVEISKYRASASGTVAISMGASGGTAMRIQPADSPSVTVAEFDDPKGDDNGPGSYTYPSNDAFYDGAFDLRQFTLTESESSYEFTFEVENLEKVFNAEYFSPQFFTVWVRDPSISNGSNTENGDLAVNVEFANDWHYRIAASGLGRTNENFKRDIIDANGEGLGIPEMTVSLTADTVTLVVEKDSLNINLTNTEVIPVVGSENFGTFRNVGETAGEFNFGGARAGATGNAPRVIDLITPDGVSQVEALAYNENNKAILPFVSL